MHAAPEGGNNLYRPVRDMICPALSEVVNRPRIIGSIASPDFVGDIPLTTCR